MTIKTPEPFTHKIVTSHHLSALNCVDICKEELSFSNSQMNNGYTAKRFKWKKLLELNLSLNFAFKFFVAWSSYQSVVWQQPRSVSWGAAKFVPMQSLFWCLFCFGKYANCQMKQVYEASHSMYIVSKTRYCCSSFS